MRKTRYVVVAFAATLALVAAACGGSDDDAGDGVEAGDVREISVVMGEQFFDPDHVTVNTGETVRFIFTNEGELPHEAVIGDMERQMEHEAEMGEHMEEQEGAEPGEIEVEPGETGSMEYTFTEPGTLIMGCHEPGHWDAGMRATIEVED